MSRFRAEMLAEVIIDVNDEHGVIGRYLPGGEYHGEHPYGLRTKAEIVGHLARCAVNMGVDEVNRLDGWADLNDGAARMHVIDVELSDDGWYETAGEAR